MTAIEQSIYDAGSEPLFDAFAKLVHQKAAKLQKLKAVDIFAWSDTHGSDSAGWKLREIAQAEHELHILIAVSEYINDMSELHDSDVLELSQKVESKSSNFWELYSITKTTINL